MKQQIDEAAREIRTDLANRLYALSEAKEPVIADAFATALYELNEVGIHRIISKHLSSGWVKVTDRLPEAYVDVLVLLVNGRLATGQLHKNNRGEIITRPLTAKDEVVRQWPAWEIGDPDDYFEATHWQPLPSPPE